MLRRSQAGAKRSNYLSGVLISRHNEFQRFPSSLFAGLLTNYK